MRIAVIGTGYVGLVTGVCFADTGNEVVCVDKDASKIQLLKSGGVPIYEPGLELLLKRNVAEGRLSFTSSTAEAVGQSEIIFMAVGTPALPEGGADLSFLQSASEEVARAMPGYRLIVNKSTVPIGSHKVVADWIGVLTRHPFDVASNPEFLKEGSAIDDFLKPDRVVVGTDKREVYDKIADLYAPFVRQGNPVIWMDPLSAELTKYACNAYLATRISFMNELSGLCDKVGGDVEEVRRGMTSDSRIGKHFLYAGAGYGGSCFPKDVQALISTGKGCDLPLGIVTAAEAANERQKRVLGRKIRKHLGESLKGKTIAVWGLAFKPNTDDMREAPSLVLIEDLLRAGAAVQAFDPIASETAARALESVNGGAGVQICSGAFDALKGAHALAVVTEWNEFRHPDFQKVKAALKTPVIFDGRNIYEPAAMKKLGFTYYGIGRREVR